MHHRLSPDRATQRGQPTNGRGSGSPPWTSGGSDRPAAPRRCSPAPLRSARQDRADEAVGGMRTSTR
eukprot:scaffold7104_cov215-Prasinococcus_capsulatus_cf.AAC.1